MYEGEIDIMGLGSVWWGLWVNGGVVSEWWGCNFSRIEKSRGCFCYLLGWVFLVGFEI